MITIRYASLRDICNFIRGEEHEKHLRSLLIDQKSETKSGTKYRETYLTVQALSVLNGETVLHTYIEQVGQQQIGNNLEVDNFDDWKARAVSKLTDFEEATKDIPNWREGFIVPESWTFSFLSWEEMRVTGEVLKNQFEQTPLAIDARELESDLPATGEVPAFQPDGVVTASVRGTGRNKMAPVQEK